LKPEDVLPQGAAAAAEDKPKAKVTDKESIRMNNTPKA
jgi:hypothetical protein